MCPASESGRYLELRHRHARSLGRDTAGYFNPVSQCVTCVDVSWGLSHHWCLSERPFQSGSVRTMRSISFFHSIPSEMTRCHSLHTSSAEHSERASRNDRMFSAMWSRP